MDLRSQLFGVGVGYLADVGVCTICPTLGILNVKVTALISEGEPDKAFTLSYHPFSLSTTYYGERHKYSKRWSSYKTLIVLLK